MLKPTHKKALVEILESGDYDSAEDMAKALVAALDELRADDTSHIVVRELPYGDGKAAFFGYGPYRTGNEARKAVEKGRAGIPGSGRVAIVPLYSPKHVADRIAAVDDVGGDLPSSHFTRIHERVSA